MTLEHQPSDSSTSQQRQLLVTGATGHVGAELVRQLLDAGQAVRAMTRRPDRLRLPGAVQVVQGDFEDPRSLEAALDGVFGVFSMSAQAIGSAPAPTHDLALAAACGRAGVSRIVKLSALGGGGKNPTSPIVQWVRASEATVTEGGTEWTLLRPGRFMTNTLAWAPMILRGNSVVATEVSIPMAFRRTASIDPRDVARVAALALTQPGHAGQIYELSGPEALTPAEELEILAAVLDKPLRLNALENAAARAGMLRYGMPEHVIDAIFADTDRSHGAEVLPTVERLSGRPPRRFEAWGREQREAFTGGERA